MKRASSGGRLCGTASFSDASMGGGGKCGRRSLLMRMVAGEVSGGQVMFGYGASGFGGFGGGREDPRLALRFAALLGTGKSGQPRASSLTGAAHTHPPTHSPRVKVRNSKR